VTDTVGFIERLPHALVASFRSSLAEAHEAALLLHVADASDPAVADQLAVTERVLQEIGAGATPTWLILNKVDRLAPEQRADLRTRFPTAIQMSALQPEDGRILRERIVSFFDRDLAEETFRIPYPQQGLLAEIRRHVRVIEATHGDALTVTVRAMPEALARIKKRLADAARRPART
jgi:GTPase